MWPRQDHRDKIRDRVPWRLPGFVAVGHKVAHASHSSLRWGHVSIFPFNKQKSTIMCKITCTCPSWAAIAAFSAVLKPALDPLLKWNKLGLDENDRILCESSIKWKGWNILNVTWRKIVWNPKYIWILPHAVRWWNKDSCTVKSEKRLVRYFPWSTGKICTKGSPDACSVHPSWGSLFFRRLSPPVQIMKQNCQWQCQYQTSIKQFIK